MPAGNPFNILMAHKVNYLLLAPTLSERKSAQRRHQVMMARNYLPGERIRIQVCSVLLFGSLGKCER